MTREKPKNLWLSRWGFILAATGSAVGLGNIWKFPYITGEFGGGAFVLMYLLCILAIGVPVMMCEIAIGRRGRGSPIDAIGRVVRENDGNLLWKAVGGMAMTAGFLILCFYVVVAGWAFAYTVKMLDGSLAATSVEALGGVFEAHNANPWELGGWSLLVALLTLWIVAKGVQKGIENAVRWMMPGLAVLLLILVGYAVTSGGFDQGFAFLFSFDTSKITGEALLAALGAGADATTADPRPLTPEYVPPATTPGAGQLSYGFGGCDGHLSVHLPENAGVGIGPDFEIDALRALP